MEYAKDIHINYSGTGNKKNVKNKLIKVFIGVGVILSIVNLIFVYSFFNIMSGI